jgi:hypothetical protein
LRNKIPLSCIVIVLYACMASAGLCGCKAELLRKYSENGNGDIRHIVYIMKNYWHTGIVFAVNNTSIKYIAAIKDFKKYSYIDIGWGDEDFYQSDGFRLCLGAIEDYAGSRDFVIRFAFSDEEYRRLCIYIENSFKKNENGHPVITSRRSKGRILFYRSALKYHLFHTCNTWVVRGFKEAGFHASPFCIITAGDLFDRLKEYGEVLKEE